MTSDSWHVLRPLLVLLLASSCAGRTAFEKLTEYDFRGTTYYTIQNLSLWECQGWCKEEPECAAASFSFVINPLAPVQETLCLLQNETMAANPSAVPKRAVSLYYMIKLTVRSDNVCNRPWQFERVPSKRLAGLDNAHIHANSKQDCLAACLNEKRFVCRSAEYSYATLQCHLSEHDRRTVDAGVGLEDAAGVDYFENLCLGASDSCRTDRTYKQPSLGVPEDQVSHYVDMHYYVDKEVMANSVAACQRACEIETDFLCRSYLYKGPPSTNSHNCQLFHLDHYTLPDGADTYQSTDRPLLDDGERTGTYFENVCARRNYNMICKQVTTRDKRYITQIMCFDKSTIGRRRVLASRKNGQFTNRGTLDDSSNASAMTGQLTGSSNDTGSGLISGSTNVGSVGGGVGSVGYGTQVGIGGGSDAGGSSGGLVGSGQTVVGASGSGSIVTGGNDITSGVQTLPGLLGQFGSSSLGTGVQQGGVATQPGTIGLTTYPAGSLTGGTSSTSGSSSSSNLQITSSGSQSSGSSQSLDSISQAASSSQSSSASQSTSSSQSSGSSQSSSASSAISGSSSSSTSQGSTSSQASGVSGSSSSLSTSGSVSSGSSSQSTTGGGLVSTSQSGSSQSGSSVTSSSGSSSASSQSGSVASSATQSNVSTGTQSGSSSSSTSQSGASSSLTSQSGSSSSSTSQSGLSSSSTSQSGSSSSSTSQSGSSSSSASQSGLSSSAASQSGSSSSSTAGGSFISISQGGSSGVSQGSNAGSQSSLTSTIQNSTAGGFSSIQGSGSSSQTAGQNLGSQSSTGISSGSGQSGSGVSLTGQTGTDGTDNTGPVVYPDAFPGGGPVGASITGESGYGGDSASSSTFSPDPDSGTSDGDSGDINCDPTGVCYDVSVHCKDTRIAVEVATNRPFNGRIYALGRSETCNIAVINSDKFRLDLTMAGQDCNTQSVNGVYTNTVVIQHHSVVMTKTDKIYKIRCTYDMSPKNITFGMMPIRDPDMIPITSAPEAPPPRIRILDAALREVETVRIGDRLTFRIEIPEQTPYGIFARSCVAMAKDSRSTFQIIDDDGCPVEPAIFPEFTKVGSALQSMYDAFRFTESYGVIFQCNVKYCLGSCEPARCKNGRDVVRSYGRRKRNVRSLSDGRGHVQETTKEAALAAAAILPVDASEAGNAEEEMSISQEILVLDLGEEAADHFKTDPHQVVEEEPYYTATNKVNLFETCPTRSSVLALAVTCAILLLIYVLTVFYFVMRKWIRPQKSLR
ncbi:serine-rich adhesin for platelets-like isoform X3 [Hyalella azteca]|uniref:Serine-rich adhesin for platelets-like isoform X3 n=1 Tax=Hyalella azteca TaxID=294128 RepID=A0A8B7PLM9_HYAAZ|nr:serine-rich adhesin for platelets-like isoform X3 [Hyalella azteca]